VSLDGLRAWIGEVERKLGMRTRVFLVLVAIAVGGAGAAIYLAVDARDSAVSESDVQELQQQLEAQIGSGEGADLSGLEAEIDALEAEVDILRRERGEGGREGAAPSGESGGKSAPPIEAFKKAGEEAK
jgi:Tfp pilus assembly protein PilO